MNDDTLPFSALTEIASKNGFEVVGVCSVVPEAIQFHRETLRHWQQKGFAADMNYMQRDPELFTEFSHFLPGVKSIVSLVARYASEDAKQKTLSDVPGFGRVARYAWGKDYHTVLKARLLNVVEDIKASRQLPSIQARVFSDAVPLLERMLALETGHGFIGKNSMLIRPGVGSYTFLSEILLTVEIEPGEQNKIRDDIKSQGCGSCMRCMVDCPTNAIVSEREIDARRCISYLTIEKRGAFNTWEAEAIGGWLFGCDVCQEVCPFNHKTGVSYDIDEFQASQGVGPYLSLESVLSITSEKEFRFRFHDSALMRTKRAGLLRNACAVAANQNQFELIPKLIERAKADSDEIVRQSALGALNRMRKNCGSEDKKRILSSQLKFLD